MKSKSVRLSKEITPIEYDITLRPDLRNFTFEGVETIKVNISKPIKSITLHSKEIEVETANILIDSEKVFASKISYNEKNEHVIFAFPKNIPAGKNKLTIVFKGILNDKMRGFYRSSYDLKGKTYHMATTQFEATDARRAFPCFDEPAQKAIFHVSLVIPKGKTAISNTLPVSRAEHEAGYDIVRFQPTPKMSTYLLAFIVGDFEFIEGKTKNKTVVRVYTTPGKKHQAKFALDCAIKTLEFFEDYFDIAYPLPVLDMIAIPDFASGAMENWGAVTYRESALLVDPDHTSSATKQWVALVVAHELAHQWFGNLVTMEWWTHLWLNEGFASYIEYLAVDKLFPKWDIWTQFATHDMGVALRLDALANTHPIEIPVHHPDEIGEIFDEVSYSKGASVIRMLASYLGEKDFRDGLRHYLKKHSYKNTETEHLWEAFEKVSKKPKGSLTKMMNNWTLKPGYPVVTVENKKGKLSFSQKRFFSSPISARKSKDKTKWEMPLNLKNNKVNYGEEGFFRTAYSHELLAKLKEPVEKKTLSPIDRLGIVRDLFALSEAGVIPTTDVLEFLPAYKNEGNYTVWTEIALGVGKLEQLLAKTPAKEKLNDLIIELFSTPFKRLGWNKKPGQEDGQRHTDSLLRALVIARLGRAGGETITKDAKTYWKKIKSGEHVDPDLRNAIYDTVATQGGALEYFEFIKLYKKETLHEEKNRLGGALGSFNDPKLLKQACEFAISGDVRPQDSMGILGSVGINPAGRDVWLTFVKNNWKTLTARYGEGGHQLARLVKAISNSPEKKHLETFRKFFKSHPTPGADRAVDQVLERLESNIAWITRDGKKIEKFLK